MEGVPRRALQRLVDHRRRKRAECAVPHGDASRLHGGGDGEGAHIVDDGQVGAQSRRNRAAIAQPEAGGGVPRRRAQRGRGVGAEGDRVPQQPVDVTAAQQIVRMLVVGGEGAARIHRRMQQRRERFEVVCRRAVADEDDLPARQLLLCLGEVVALVIRSDAGGYVGVQRATGQTRRVTVDRRTVRAGICELLQHVAVAADHTDIVHHLRESQHPRLPVKRAERRGGEGRAALVERRGGHTGGQHDLHVQRQPFGRLQHVADAVRAHHVRNLMRVGHHCGGAVRRDRAGKRGRQHHAALEMDVPVDEAGADDTPGHVQHLASLIPLAHGGDHAVRDRHVRAFECAGEHVENLPAAQHQIGDLVAVCHTDQALSCLVHAFSSFAVMAANVPFVARFRSAGDRKICAPSRPPLMMTVSNASAEASMTVGKAFFMPSGDTPPRI